MKHLSCLLIPLALLSCGEAEQPQEQEQITIVDPAYSDDEKDDFFPEPLSETSIVILGTCQDGGSPQINCHKECCMLLQDQPDLNRMVVSLGVIDPKHDEKYIFEATPDFSKQLADLSKYEDLTINDVPTGIFLTHAHIGHYTGLMYLGKEAMNAEMVPVYAMPKMYDFLKNNGPWSQLVTNKNIELFEIFEGSNVLLNEDLSITPWTVPHRDEFSETVGYQIKGPNKSALFIPDIDKWEKWDNDISEAIKAHDYAFLDATFFDGNELPGRDMSEVPHPFVVESMDLFKDLSEDEKSNIIFIHFNHTNPLLDVNSEAYNKVIENGFRVAKKGDVFAL